MKIDDALIEKFAQTIARRAPNAFAFPDDVGDDHKGLLLENFSQREQMGYRRLAKALLEAEVMQERRARRPHLVAAE